MKLKVFFLIFCGFHLVQCGLVIDNSDIEATSTAIAEVCEEYFTKKSTEFDVILYGESTGRLNDIINCLLTKIVRHFPTIVEHVRNIYRWDHKLDKSAVIFVSNEYFLGKFSNFTQLTNIFPKQLTFLTYYEFIIDFMLKHSLSLDIKYPNDRTSIKSHQYFLGNSNYGESVILLTIDNFSDRSCNNPLINIISKYNKYNKNWSKTLDYYKKFDNFHGCPLTVTDNFGPYLYPKQRFTDVSECFTKDFEKCVTLLTYLAETTGLQGFSVDIFNIAAKAVNFTPNYKLRISITNTQLIGNPPEVGFYVSTYNEVLKSYAPTSLNFVNSFLLAATPSEFYNNYEKLWLPFDGTTWLLLLITFVSAYFVILGLHYAPRIIRNSIIGVNITTPALNLVQVFLDNSLTKLPKTSLARFILMLFIGFCLIFRTLYQSKSFDLMTSDIRKPPPKTVEDLIVRNYTIVTYADGHEEILNEMIPSVKSRINLKTYQQGMENLQAYCNNYDKTDAKLAFFLEDVQYVMMNSICKGAAVKLKNFKEDGNMPVLFTVRNSFLYKTLNQILEKIIPAGIPQYLIKYHEANLYGTFIPFVENSPRVLTIEDLAHGFVLWLSACGVSFIAFSFEILWFRVTIWMTHLIGLWILMSILKDRLPSL